MQEIFVALLRTEDAVIDPRIITLRWEESNYNDFARQLYVRTNLPILSDVYKMAEQDRKLIRNSDEVCSIPIDLFPFELVEMILVTKTVHLFVTINRRTPRAEVYTLATMTAVSRLWWEALSYRKYIKRLLKRSFKRACRPFECTPRYMKSLHIEGNSIRMTVLENELFVARGGSDTILVFESRPPFSRLPDIIVRGLKDANDIAVCDKLSRLYVAD